MSEDLPPIVSANVQRWSAEDDGWRGYKREGERIVPDDRVRRVLELATPRPGCDYLDIGCANGVLTGLIADRLQAKTVTGIDYVNMDLPSRMRFLKANLDKTEPLPVADASFDVVSCMETLEHVHDTDHLVAEIRRALRPNGYAIVSVPRLDAILNVAMLAAGLQPPAVECSLARRYGSNEPNARVSGHVSHFTKRALEQLLDQQGFVVEAFAQAGIFSAWRAAQSSTPPWWQRAPLWLASKIPVKQDVLVMRARLR